MLSHYRPLFSVPGARTFITGGMIARSAGAMFGVATVAMIAARRDLQRTPMAISCHSTQSILFLAHHVAHLVHRHSDIFTRLRPPKLLLNS